MFGVTLELSRQKLVVKKYRKPNLDLTAVEGLGKSEENVGQLQPVLVDKSGNIIDGMHRITVDPKWKVERLDWVKTEKDRVLVKLHANYRRQVSKKELSKDFVDIAQFLLREGEIKDPRDAASAVAKLVPYSERYVRELLPTKFKHMEFKNCREEQIPPILPSKLDGKEEEAIISNEKTYIPVNGRILAQNILPKEWFTVANRRCFVDWELKKIWVLPSS